MKKTTKKIITLGLISFLLFSTAQTCVADNPSSWADSETQQAIDAKIIPVHLQVNYQQPITRQEFVDLVVNLLKNKLNSSEQSLKQQLIAFPQIRFNDSNHSSVLLARQLGIIKGENNNNFNPNATISRQEAAVILHNLTNLSTAPPVKISHSSFTDASIIAPWAQLSVYTMAEQNILKGRPNHSFGPKGKYTREQAYISCWRLYNQFNFSEANLLEKAKAVKKAPFVEKNTDSNNFRQQILKLVNQERAKINVPPLTMNTSLTSYADLRAKEIITHFSHTRPDGSQGIHGVDNYRIIGENIAIGYPSAETVMNGWMQSDGHRKNILNSSFKELSVGYARLDGQSNYRGYSVVQLFYTAMD